MASMWQRTLYYLGLVDEGDADEGVAAATAAPRAPSQAEVRTVEPVNTSSPRSRTDVPGRRVEPPMGSRRRISENGEYAEAGVYMMTGDDRPTGYGDHRGESDVILARAFSDAQQLADSLKGGRSVVMDLRGTEPEMVRRLVDFSSGLTYALNGGMRKIAQGVILVSPQGAHLSASERERLAGLGLYEAREDD